MIIVAVIKHVAIKNSNYNAAYDYLTTKHDEFTGKPILDEKGRRIPRDGYLIAGINCEPGTFQDECSRTNAHFGKNTERTEIKAHHYIISFDPRDRDENGLTTQRAQELGMAFASTNFPGHQVLVCTHPDGHGNAGNIHVHIVLNSVRAYDTPWKEFMERPGDCIAGNKHHVTKDFLEYLKQQTMEMCQYEGLNQVNLLAPAKVRITDREYWAQRRGQRALDEQAVETGEPKSRYQTQNMILREQIHSTMLDSHSFEEFERKLLSNYGILIQESRGQLSYHLPDRVKPIRGKTLGTDFEKASIFRYFAIGYRIVSDTSIHTIKDISQNEKAQGNTAYARAIKVDNLKQVSKAVAYLQEHGIAPEELEKRFQAAAADSTALTETRQTMEKQIAQLKNVDYALKQYYETKSIHSEYLKARNKKKFREQHTGPLSIYDAAVKELHSVYGKEKFPSRKVVREQLAVLQHKYHDVYEDFCNARAHYSETKTLRINYQSLLDQEQPDAKRDLEPEKPLK